MKKIYLVLAACVVMLSVACNTAIAGVNYTDYGVKTEAELNSALTTDDGNAERIHIMSNINLQNNLSTPANPDGMVIMGEGSNITIDAGGVEGRAFVGHTIDNLTFTNFKIHTGTWGGVMSNWSGSQNIYNSTFTNNTGSGSNTNGAALVNANSGAIMNIYNSHFTKNTVTDRGGAIYNDDSGIVNIFHSTFGDALDATSGNIAGKGGAVHSESGYIRSSILQISDSTFNSNIANVFGGAISNDYATTNVFNSEFNSNMAVSSGGAIYNASGSILQITDSTFNSNIANGHGGAIYNVITGNTYIASNWKNVTFSGNKSDLGLGGAIYNEGNLYLTANTSGMNFSGNTGGDIYNTGTVWLNAGLADMTFNSGIISTGNIYINSSGVDADINNDGVLETAPTTGRIILNSALTGAGNVEVDGDTLKVGTGGSIGASGNPIGALKFGNGTDTSSPILDLANGSVSGIYSSSSNIAANNTTSIWMDVDLTNPTTKSDTINTTGAFNVNGNLSLATVRMLHDATDTTAVPVAVSDFGSGNFGTLSSQFRTYTNNYAYTVDLSSGVLSFNRGDNPVAGLRFAVEDAVDAERSFSLIDSNYDADSSYTLSAGMDVASTKTLTVFGTGKSGLAINGKYLHKLFNVPQYAQLNIVDAVIKNAYGTEAIGTAINNAGTLNVYNSLFDNNKAPSFDLDSYGGAIYNSGTAYIANSDFTGNLAATFGGAIANSGATARMNIYHSNFTNNRIQHNGGGAISNTDGATLNVSDSTFGGDDSSLANASSHGGAIYNTSTANIYNSTFNNNQSPQGGAIYNNETTNVYNSTFASNIGATGGALYNVGGVSNLYNSTFTNNFATDKGGAIYSDGGTVNLIASGQDVTFSDNTATNGGNDIYLTNSAKLNLNTTLGNKITVGGVIKSSAIADGIININKMGSATAGDPPTGVPTTGEMVLGAPIETSTVNLYNGTLTLNNDSYLDYNALTLNGGTLNMQNAVAGDMTLNSLALANGKTTNLAIDVDLANSKVDTINLSSGSTTGTGTLKINSVKLLSNSTGTSTVTTLTNDSALASHITLGVTKAYTPIYQYNVNYNDATGGLTFAGGPGSGGGGGFNPAILDAPVSANVGAYMSQVSVYNEALGRSELFMSLPQQERLLMKQRNMYANVGGSDVQPEVFSPTFLPDEKGGVWFKQYTSFENVPMNNGPNVSNVGYGAMIGADSPMYHLKNGYDGYLTTYVAYNGSHQNYDAVGVNQNGGALGLTGTLYKGNLFTALTASVGDSYGQANTMYGVDNFNTLLAGLAWKTGYNIEMAQGKFILQPSLLAAYTFANTFDYTTASGVNMTSDPMNAIQIAPGVKFIANMENGWQPYLAANMVFNIMDKQKFQANDVQLPQMSIAPYIEYGIGVQRRWGERFTGFGQAMLRGGGRNGIALQFGFRIAIGK